MSQKQRGSGMGDSDEKRFGRQIACARIGAGWSQADLADMVGLTPKELNDMEWGRKPFPIGMVSKIREVLG